MLKGKKILVGVTGGIAAYKAADVVNDLVKCGAEVHVMMTRHATEFITPLTLQTLSKNKVIIDMFEESEPALVGHIHYGQDMDLILVLPITANVLGKVANGIADDMLSSTLIAATSTIILAPAMNDKMYANPFVQENIKRLEANGYHIIYPATGRLACGTIGMVKLAPIHEVLDYVKSVLK